MSSSNLSQGLLSANQCTIQNLQNQQRIYSFFTGLHNKKRMKVYIIQSIFSYFADCYGSQPMYSIMLFIFKEVNLILSTIYEAPTTSLQRCVVQMYTSVLCNLLKALLPEQAPSNTSIRVSIPVLMVFGSINIDQY